MKVAVTVCLPCQRLCCRNFVTLKTKLKVMCCRDVNVVCINVRLIL